jgi:hypothetical protein
VNTEMNMQVPYSSGNFVISSRSASQKDLCSMLVS